MKHQVTKLRAAAGKVLDGTMLDHFEQTAAIMTAGTRLTIFRRKESCVAFTRPSAECACIQSPLIRRRSPVCLGA
jgi:hypothetical protein